ncbi:septum formation initiator family protein [Parageobacillus sp. KH3-4]|uniref:FtsB family cell division protein n=1 Tax=Parageobacillus sp. KH3-4 TaxID=2916802 RepID=UPI001FCAE295|nr:septum formation initiator family protein [Parageobacillus sp. KH3-4]BDG45497.1 cell division protein DIVIC [Parageobacillus sp. KH3-4]
MNVPRRTNVTKLQSSYISAQEEKRTKASRRRRIAIVRFVFFGALLASLSSIFFYTLHSQSKDIEAKLADKKRVEQQLDKLEKQQKQLEDEIKKLHDDEYIAELARKKYYLSKEGEIIFVVPEKKSAPYDADKFGH